MGGAIGAGPTRVHQGVGIAAVGLHAARPLSGHRRIVRVGHDDLAAQLFQAAGDPLTLRGRLEENLGRGPTAKHLDQARRSVRMRRWISSPSSVRIAIWLSLFPRSMPTWSIASLPLRR
jgi:hypothetical protein